MDGGGVTPPSESCSSLPKTHGGWFEYLCPVYLSYGMTLEQYWDGDTDLPKYFREKNKLERDRKNFESWLQGRYIYDALCAVAPLVRAFSKATEPLPYRDRPLPLTKAELDAEIERKEQEQMQKNIDALRDMTKEWNKQRKGESEVD